MNENTLTIKVTGRTEYVPVASFIAIVEDTLALLRGLDATISQTPNGVLVWRIADVSHDSPLTLKIFAESEDDTGVDRQVIDACTEGLRQIDRESQRKPKHFTDASLEKARKLVSVLNDGVFKITYISPWSPPVEPSQRVAANVDLLLPKEHEEWGSIEGRLETLSIHDRTVFVIWSVLDGARVECRFSRDILDEVTAAFGKRVSVQGMIHYNRSGIPRTIKLNRIQVLRDRKDLPQARDLEGIDITGGVDPAEYVRGFRDDD